jgi:2-methylcitrate dehydratase PrpD
MFEGWGEALEIADPSIGLKQFPCCGSTHPAIAMALDIAREVNIGADCIEAIEILPHGRRLRHTDTPDPRTPLEAKFSVQYVVARALADQAVRLAHFEPAAVMEPRIRALLAVTQARPHPDMADDAPAQWGAEVILTTKDGRRLSRRVDDMVGRGGDNPMSSDELWEKFSDCAELALPREQIMPLFERLETVDKAASVADVTRLLEVKRLHATPPSGRVRFAKASEHQAEETTWVP